MTRIRTNRLLNPTDRSIRNWKSTFTDSDGPNEPIKIDLIDLGIPYDSHYRSRVVLPAFAENYFLNYGSLEDVTFLLIKVTYNGNYDYAMEDSFDPLYRYEKDTYNINYYFEDNSGVTYPIGRLLLLNGSYNQKLTKIYLNNPLGYDVVLDVLHANIDDPIIPTPSNDITISNLYYNDITTNTGICNSNSGFTGSTEFIINEYSLLVTSGYTINEYHLPYNTILSIEKDVSLIYVHTTSRVITLKFLTEFDCSQTYSRMMFAFSSYPNKYCRYLTDNDVYQNNSAIVCVSGYTGVDLVPPVIHYNSSSYWTGSGTTIPTNIFLPFVYSGITGWTLNSLRTLFISGVTDCWDGNITLSSITFELYKKGTIMPLTGITENGIFNIFISVTDNAGNNITNNIVDICVDNTPPVIVCQYGVIRPITGDTSTYSGSTNVDPNVNILQSFAFDLNGFISNKITKKDILDNIVDYVYDNIDTTLDKYMIDVLLVSQVSGGTEVEVMNYSDYFLCRFSISDSSGNECINYFLIAVIVDSSVYSSGYWRDEKVWIDTDVWIDFPI